MRVNNLKDRVEVLENWRNNGFRAKMEDIDNYRDHSNKHKVK